MSLVIMRPIKLGLGKTGHRQWLMVNSTKIYRFRSSDRFLEIISIL